MIELKNLFAFLILWGYCITIIGTILMLVLLIIRDNQLERAKAKAIKEFAERICKGRVANDPVVIAVKCELKEMVGEKDV